jgi:hypothetical protein
VSVSLAGQPVAELPLVALKDVEAGNFIQRFYDKIARMTE